MAGYYLMHRGWLDHPVFGTRKREPFCRAAAWAWMIEEAAYEPRRVSVGGTMIELQRGQISHSLRFMAEAWGWHKNRVDRFLDELAAEGMIARTIAGQQRDSNGTETGTHGGTARNLVTICNYETYQAPKNRRGTLDGTAVKNSRSEFGTNLKEGKNLKKESPPPPFGGVVEFDQFYEAYPRHVGRAAAHRKYVSARSTVDAETLLNAAKRYAELVAGKEPQYVAHPATWLHHGRWQDEELQSPSPNGRDPGPTGPTPRPEDLWPDLKETRH